MMDIKYYKEQQRTYMVIKKENMDPYTDYQQKMLVSKRMEFLLPVNVRNLNGEQYTCYDISSRLSLEQMYGSRSLDAEDIKTLIDALAEACDEVDRYLLDIRRLDLSPRLIFYDHGSERYFFLYNISSDIAECENGIAELMDYLLDKVSPDDPKAADLIYTMYEYYEKGNFDVWQLISIAERSVGTEIREGAVGSDAMPECDIHEMPEEYLSVENVNFGEDSDPERKIPCRRIAPYFLAAIGGLGIAACIVVKFMLYLNETESTVWIAAVCAFGLLAVAGAVMAAGGRIWSPSIKKGGEEDESDACVVFDDNYIPTLRMQEFVALSGRDAMNRRGDGISVQDCISRTEESAQTVFFDEATESGTYKLYAMDRKNKQHINLDHFPCTIGKMSGYVDCMIDDPTISRMHARVDLVEDQLVLCDLNSTNGIYLNGIRLMPNEQRPIEAGDEIRFGRLNYCLRRCG